MKFNSRNYFTQCMCQWLGTDYTSALPTFYDLKELIGQNSINFGDIQFNDDGEKRNLIFKPHSEDYNQGINYNFCEVGYVNNNPNNCYIKLDGSFSDMPGSRIMIFRTANKFQASIRIYDGHKGIYYIRFNEMDGNFSLKYYDGEVLDLIDCASGMEVLGKKNESEFISYQDELLHGIGFEPDFVEEASIQRDGLMPNRMVIPTTFSNASLAKFKRDIEKQFKKHDIQYKKRPDK